MSGYTNTFGVVREMLDQGGTFSHPPHFFMSCRDRYVELKIKDRYGDDYEFVMSLSSYKLLPQAA